MRGGGAARGRGRGGLDVWRWKNRRGRGGEEVELLFSSRAKAQSRPLLLPLLECDDFPRVPTHDDMYGTSTGSEYRLNFSIKSHVFRKCVFQYSLNCKFVLIGHCCCVSARHFPASLAKQTAWAALLFCLWIFCLSSWIFCRWFCSLSPRQTVVFTVHTLFPLFASPSSSIYITSCVHFQQRQRRLF